LRFDRFIDGLLRINEAAQLNGALVSFDTDLNDLKKSSSASRDFTLVVMTESSTYSPVLSCVRVDEQATKVISIRKH